MTSPTHRRDPLLDALRALAMVGVLVVNAISYTVGPWGAPLGEADPASMLSLGLQSLTALLLHGKAYPLLAFLFGAGLVLASRRATLQDRRRRLLASRGDEKAGCRSDQGRGQPCSDDEPASDRAHRSTMRTFSRAEASSSW